MEVSLIGVEKSGLLVFFSVLVYFKLEGGRQLDLDLVHCIDITRLDKVLKLFNLLAQLLDGNLVILNGAHDLQFFDAITNGDELAGSPEKAVHLNALHVLKHLVHVSLIVPGLHIKENRGFGNDSSLLGLLLMVSLQPLLSDPLLLLRLLFVAGSKEIDIIVIISSCCSRSSSATKRESRAGFRELLHAGAKRLDVVVPAKGMGILGCSSKSLIHLCVGLAWHKPLDVAVICEEAIEGLHSGRGLQVSEHYGVSCRSESSNKSL